VIEYNYSKINFMAKQELLTQNPAEQVETNPSRLQTTVDAMKKLGSMRIEIPDSLKKKVKGVGLATTLALTGAFVTNIERGFAMTPQEAIEGLANGSVVDARLIGINAQRELQKINNPGSKIEIEISGNVQKGLGPLISKDMLPKSVIEKITTPSVIPSTESSPSQPTRVIEQPTQPVQPPKPPSSDGFPFLPLAIVGAAAIGGAAFYKDKIQEGLSGTKKEPKRYKGKGNEQFGMPNTDPDGTNSLEMADRIAQQKRALQQSEQVELVAFQDLAVLEQALEEAVKDGMRPNSIAYRKAKAEIDQKKKEFDKKYLS
jgi:hypothetical protein